jgi:hypothetical protein
MAFNPASFVGDVIEGTIDFAGGVVESALDKPLTTLLTGGATAVTESFTENILVPVGREVGRELSGVVKGATAGLELFGPGRGREQATDATAISLVEDSQPTEPFDPRGRRGTRGRVTTQTQSILTPTAEQPTLLG